MQGTAHTRLPSPFAQILCQACSHRALKAPQLRDCACIALPCTALAYLCCGRAIHAHGGLVRTAGPMGAAAGRGTHRTLLPTAPLVPVGLRKRFLLLRQLPAKPVPLRGCLHQSARPAYNGRRRGATSHPQTCHCAGRREVAPNMHAKIRMITSLEGSGGFAAGS